MANRYDIESVMDDIKAFLQANLNTKITAMNTEKNDTITLSSISNNAYFFQTLGEDIANFNPFILYGVNEIGGKNNLQSAVDMDFTGHIVVVLTDGGNDPNIIRRLFRYQRCLIDLFENNWSKISKIGSIKVSGLAPLNVLFENRPASDRVIGISIEVHLP